MPKIDMLAQFFTDEVCKPKTAKRKPPKKEVKKRQPKKPAPKKKQAAPKKEAPKKEKPKKVNGMTVGTVYKYDEDGKRTTVRRDRKVRRMEKAPPPPPEKKPRKPRKWKPTLHKHLGDKERKQIRKLADAYQKRCNKLDEKAREIVHELKPYLNTKNISGVIDMFKGNVVAFYLQEWRNALEIEEARKKKGGS